MAKGNAAKPSSGNDRQESGSLTKTATKLYRTRKTPPDKPPKDYVTVVCISDTHNHQPKLPDGDLLVHAGDLSRSGTFAELQAQLDWLNSQKHTHKVLISGNHDRLLDAKLPRKTPGLLGPSQSRSDLNWGSLVYLENSSAKLKFANGRTLRVYGSPHVPALRRWAFGVSHDADVWSRAIPKDTDIVVTHNPPKWHRDRTLKGKHVGCPYLLKELKRVRPRLVICGHIHESHGEEKLMFDEVDGMWESIMEADGRSGGLLRLTFRVHWWNTTKAGAAKYPKYTRLVNASIVEGGRVSKGRVAYNPVVCLI